jgi:predicted ArsR family transcriptional regulator
MVVLRHDDQSSASGIIRYLQRNGEATIRQLEDALQVSTTAVREQLTHLQAEGLVLIRSERHGPGRPRSVYALSEKAQSRFPKQYDRLIALLLHELNSEGQERVNALLERVSQRLADEYAARMNGTDVQERLKELRQLLEARGVAVEVVADSNTIQLFSCPYYEIAHEHPEVCSMERQMLEYVLGEKLVLESSIREGGHNCRFVVRESR